MKTLLCPAGFETEQLRLISHLMCLHGRLTLSISFLHSCVWFIIWERGVVNAFTSTSVFHCFYPRLFIIVPLVSFLVLLAGGETKQDHAQMIKLTSITLIHHQLEAHRFFWSTVETSRNTMPALTRPITTPNTMSHGGVAGLTGDVRVGRMPINSRVSSLSSRMLLMRFLDPLLDKEEQKLQWIIFHTKWSPYKYCCSWIDHRSLWKETQMRVQGKFR